MARVQFSSTIEEIVGKLAGSVFQDSYGGFQLRSRVSPSNPQSYYQQLRRGMFAYLTESWRFLSEIERSSWVSLLNPGISPFNLFVQSNINLSLLNLPPISTYVEVSQPVAFPLAISELSPPSFSVLASTGLSIVPAGRQLLIFATSEKEQSQIFTNPSMYSPIVAFGPGTDMALAQSIASAWVERFGQFTSAKRICIKSVLIAQSSGQRSTDSIVCAIESTPEKFFLIDNTGTLLIDNASNFITSQ